MAGYWPSFILFCMFRDRDGDELHKQAWSTGLIIRRKEKHSFLAGHSG